MLQRYITGFDIKDAEMRESVHNQLGILKETGAPLIVSLLNSTQ